MRKYPLVTVIAATVGVMLLAGGALAASRYIITNISQIKPSVRAQLRGQTGPPGVIGPRGPQGVQGVVGAQGVQGIQGAPGSARAFAVVNAAGQLVVGKGVTSIGHASGSGVYCVALSSGIDARAAMVTPSPTGTTTGSDAPAAATDPTGSNCRPGQAEVVTYDATAGGVQDDGFVMLVP
jgi:hypothetical protein